VPIRFQLEAVIMKRTFVYNLALELPKDFKELRVLEEDLAVDGEGFYSRAMSHIELGGARRDSPVSFGLDWHLFALPIIQSRPTDDPLSIFREWLAQILTFAPIPSQITGDAESETLTPQEDGSDLGGWIAGLLSRSPASYATIDRHLRDLMPDFKHFTYVVTPQGTRSLMIQFEHGEAQLTVPFRYLSDGEKCFFISAVILAASEAYGPTFCFWDEPDNYLAPSEVGHFVMELRRRFQAGGQLIATSHNIEAIRQFTDENTLVLHRHSHLEPTLTGWLSDIGYTGDLGDALRDGDIEPRS
jgi:hypothetical protein